MVIPHGQPDVVRAVRVKVRKDVMFSYCSLSLMCLFTSCQGSGVSECLREEQSKESQTEEKGLSIFQAPFCLFHLFKGLRPFQSVQFLGTDI